MSPGTRCLTSSLVRRPGRTDPATVRTVARRSPETAPVGEGAPEGLDRVAAIAARVTLTALRRSVCSCSRRASQLARVAARAAVVLVGAEHAHELAEHLALGELDHGGACGVGGGVLDDREVALGERGDLGQMRDA